MKSDQVVLLIAIFAILFFLFSPQKLSMMYGGAKKEACCGMNKMY